MKKNKIEELNRVKHNGKFDLSKVPEEFGIREKFEVICPEHGSFFTTWESFVRNENGCRKCRTEFMRRLPQGNSEKFDYSKIVLPNFITLKDKVLLGCKTCGKDFEQRAQYHVGGGGCPYCSGRLRDKEIFVQKAKAIWGDKFDFSKFEYKGAYGESTVICTRHNAEFQTRPQDIFRNNPLCPVCSKNAIILNKATMNFGEVDYYKYRALKLKHVHADKLSFVEEELVKASSNKEFITITCPTHGPHRQRMGDTMKGQGCPRCSPKNSKGQLEIQAYLASLGVEFEVEKRVLKGKECDIFIPSLNMAFEYNGLYWHSESMGKDKRYHLNKTELAESLGIRLIQIFEDEWVYNQSLVKDKIRYLVGKEGTTTYARKLQLEQNLPWAKIKEFITETHIQGQGQATSINYALVEPNSGVIQAVMTFGKPRFDGSIDSVELIRFCSRGSVVGGFSRLLKAYCESSTAKRIISYADRRWSTGNVYLINGFKLLGASDPGYYWCKAQQRHNRVDFQRHKLEAKFGKVFDQTLTETQICESQGYVKVYDCGQLKFELVL